MRERLKKHLKSLTEKERLYYLRKEVANAIKEYKAKENAVNAEFNYNYFGSPKRTSNNRGGRSTTLTAKAMNNTQNYLRTIEDIKLIVKFL